jgi:hypothetical protein
MKSDQINELACALAKAQSEILGASKDSSNPFFKSKYADLSSVWDACRIALTKNGLCVSQMVEPGDNGEILCTMLIHASGQWLSSTMPIKVRSDGKGGPNELQALGSTLTYLRRFSLAAIVGVAPADEDDDGQTSQTNYGKTELKLPSVSKQQLDLLNSIIPQCSPAFRQSIEDFMDQNNYSSFESLEKNQVQQIINSAKIDLVKFKKEVPNVQAISG